MSAPNNLTDGGSFNARRTQIILNEDGTGSLYVEYTAASSGRHIGMHIMLLPGAQGLPVIDQSSSANIGNMPAGLQNAINTFLASVDSTLAAAAGAGKLNLNQ